MDKHEIFTINENVSIGYDCMETFISRIITSDTRKYILCIDSNVSNMYWNGMKQKGTVLQYLLECFQNPIKNKEKILLYYILPALAKSRRTKDELEDFMLENYCHRDTLLIAVGGGSVSDLVGFTASTYCRGIPWIAIPTTLLAMADASIGGKTGIDVPPYAKNTIGAFWLPNSILIDFSFLTLQSEDIWRQGWAEMIKMTIVFDKCRFEQIETLLQSNQEKWSDIWSREIANGFNYNGVIVDFIIWSIKKKLDIVDQDMKEISKKRSLLNFGHTIGHALENLCMVLYRDDKIVDSKINHCRSHGDAVGYGMILETELCLYSRRMHDGDCYRIINLLESGFGWKKSDISGILERYHDQIMDALLRDKKSCADQVGFVDIQSLGNANGVYFPMISDVHFVLSESINLSTINIYHSNTIIVPASKSITNRALILASILVNSESSDNYLKLTNILHSQDTYLMIEALKKFEIVNLKWTENNESLEIYSNQKLHSKDIEIQVGNAGTVVRFLIPFCIFVLQSFIQQGNNDFKIVFYGNPRMIERPFEQILDALGNECLKFHSIKPQDKDKSIVPIISVFPLHYNSKDLHIKIKSKGSSQFLSGLIMSISGKCYLSSITSNEMNHVYYISVLEISSIEEMDSAPFVSMTIQLVHEFYGSRIELSYESSGKDLIFKISKKCRSIISLDSHIKSYSIETDMTSASYPCTAAALSGSSIMIPNVLYLNTSTNNHICLQGDVQYLDILAHFGCKFKLESSGILIFSGPESGNVTISSECCHSQTKPCIVDFTDFINGTISIDFSDIGDTFMTFTIFISCILLKYNIEKRILPLKTIILKGLSSQERKESNRVSIMNTILSKQLGLNAYMDEDDSLIISADEYNYEIRTISIDPHQDHRIAMACSLLLYSSHPEINKGLIIKEKNCTSKTWPSYWRDMKESFDWSIEGIK